MRGEGMLDAFLVGTAHLARDRECAEGGGRSPMEAERRVEEAIDDELCEDGANSTQAMHVSERTQPLKDLEFAPSKNTHRAGTACRPRSWHHRPPVCCLVGPAR